MQLMKRVIAAALSLSVLLGLSFSASAHEMIPGCTVPPDGPNAISVGQATMDDSQGYDILAQFELRFEVEMDVDALPADLSLIHISWGSSSGFRPKFQTNPCFLPP